MLPELIAKYDQRLPRYTSYPTAPCFRAEIDDQVYGDWLCGLDCSETASIYLHVPFCRSLCWYCGCHTAAVNGHEPVAAYARLLEQEIDLVGGSVGARLPVRAIHWGGGTPSILHRSEIESLMAALRARFLVAENAELSIELDPRRCSRELIWHLVELGINRASLGIQDFDERVQRAVNRVQPYRMTADTVTWLREAGIAGLNFDLIYGLPYQTVGSIQETACRAADLSPDRIALFGYAHVPWLKPRQALLPETALPNAADRFCQANAAAAILEERGYVRIGLDHFARPDDSLAQRQRQGGLARNFQGYTTDGNPLLLGFGVSAIGKLPQGYIQNTTDIAIYRDRLRFGRLGTKRGFRLSADDKLRGAIIERLMCDLTVDLEWAASAFDQTPDQFAPELAGLEALTADGLARLEGWRIDVTEAGRPFVRAVASLFDSYLAAPPGEQRPRYSRAV